MMHKYIAILFLPNGFSRTILLEEAKPSLLIPNPFRGFCLSDSESPPTRPEMEVDWEFILVSESQSILIYEWKTPRAVERNT